MEPKPLRNPFDAIHEDRPASPGGTATKEPRVEPKPKPDHAEAREIYEAYLRREVQLAPHRAYAERVAKATSGGGMTPVEPLATMGTGCGPLLCDRCGKPMILEGGSFQGVYADAAWRANPNANSSWRSYVSGGMVVDILSNGTLRIYHGYPGAAVRYCCNVARAELEKAEREFQPPKTRSEAFKLIRLFLEDEYPDWSADRRRETWNAVLSTFCEYDPGVGINRPGGV